MSDRLPFAFIGAGLPHLPSYIAKAATYTERFRYERTDNLHDQEARAAVLEPAAAEAVSWHDEALAKVVTAAAGYPYFLQLYAFEAWEAAVRTAPIERITLDDVEAGESVAKRQIEAGIYDSRFEGATESERTYLFAMSDLMDVEGDRVRSGEVARALDRELSAVSPTRDALIRKGIVHAPEHGLLAFSIPGFQQYIVRRRSDEDRASLRMQADPAAIAWPSEGRQDDSAVCGRSLGDAAGVEGRPGIDPCLKCHGSSRPAGQDALPGGLFVDLAAQSAVSPWGFSLAG